MEIELGSKEAQVKFLRVVSMRIRRDRLRDMNVVITNVDGRIVLADAQPARRPDGSWAWMSQWNYVPAMGDTVVTFNGEPIRSQILARIHWKETTKKLEWLYLPGTERKWWTLRRFKEMVTRRKR